jgi:Ser/Thr protein kinase RdoA (MazF antagonist)
MEQDLVKPYDELTRLGRLRRLRQLARVALEAYGLTGSRLKFLHYEGNVIFRVDAAGPAPVKGKGGPYLENRYVLRILTTSDTAAIASELTWLDALSREAGLPVPEPVPTLEGKLLTTIATPGVPQGRHVSLMRWMDGRQLTKGLRPHHARAWGKLVAQLHQFAAGWQPPAGFDRPHWDWHGQLGGRGFRRPVEELVASMPEQFQEPFQLVSQQAREVMEALGKGADAYGIVHADMYLENVLFKAGEPRIIDFEDCGYSYWMFDIGTALAQWPWTTDFPWIRDAFLDGYAQIRTLPEAQLKHLDLFMAAHHATMVLWASMFIKHDPAMQAEYEKWRNREGNKLLRYFEAAEAGEMRRK